MSNLNDYLKQNKNITFLTKKVNVLDILLMSQIALLDFDKVMLVKSNRCPFTMKKLSRDYFSQVYYPDKTLGLMIGSSNISGFKELAESRRFQDIKLSDYINIVNPTEEIQISAVTAHINNKKYIIFSGTDDSVVGWKENFDMLHKRATPSQKYAVSYVEYIASKYPGAIVLVGHSKGGADAMYAGVHVNDRVFKKIVKIYCFDAPSIISDDKFSDQFLSRVKKIESYIPDMSIVGRIYYHKEKTYIVKSESLGICQHNPYTWQNNGDDFLYCKKLDPDSDKIDKVVKNLVNNMTLDEKIAFTNEFANLFKKSHITNLIDVTKRKTRLFVNYFRIPVTKRAAFYKPIRKLLINKYIRYAILNTYRGIRKK